MHYPEINQRLSDIIRALLPSARAESQCLPRSKLPLYLINPDYPQDALDSAVALQLMEQPLYWAFCWASGDVLAHYILEHSAIVKNKSVVDFGSGSGVVAIAAAKAGAKQVIACDNDPNALIAIEENAKLNQVELQLLNNIDRLTGKAEVLLTADVLYDRENLPLLDRFLTWAETVIVADSRIKNFSHYSYQCVAECDANTWPDLDESKEFRRVKIYQSSTLAN